MTRPSKTLEQMAAEAANGGQRMTIAGKPASVCPNCGGAMFIDGVNRTEREIVRYVECRNNNCRKRYLTVQQPAKFLREVTKDEPHSAGGILDLTLHQDSA